jgi:hypothetical protein
LMKKESGRAALHLNAEEIVQRYEILHSEGGAEMS